MSEELITFLNRPNNGIEIKEEVKEIVKGELKGKVKEINEIKVEEIKNEEKLEEGYKIGWRIYIKKKNCDIRDKGDFFQKIDTVKHVVGFYNKQYNGEYEYFYEKEKSKDEYLEERINKNNIFLERDKYLNEKEKALNERERLLNHRQIAIDKKEFELQKKKLKRKLKRENEKNKVEELIIEEVENSNNNEKSEIINNSEKIDNVIKNEMEFFKMTGENYIYAVNSLFSLINTYRNKTILCDILNKFTLDTPDRNAYLGHHLLFSRILLCVDELLKEKEEDLKEYEFKSPSEQVKYTTKFKFLTEEEQNKILKVIEHAEKEEKENKKTETN